MIEPEIAGSTDGGLYVDILSVGGSVDRGRYRSPVCLRPGQDISLLYVVVDITPCRRRKAFTEIQPDFCLSRGLSRGFCLKRDLVTCIGLYSSAEICTKRYLCNGCGPNMIVHGICTGVCDCVVSLNGAARFNTARIIMCAGPCARKILLKAGICKHGAENFICGLRNRAGFAQIDVVIIPFALALGDKIDAQKRCVCLRGEGRGQHLPAVCRTGDRIAELCILVIFLPGAVALTECEICFCGFCGTIRSFDLDGNRVLGVGLDGNAIICAEEVAAIAAVTA